MKQNRMKLFFRTLAMFALMFTAGRANSILTENLNGMGLNKINSLVTWCKMNEDLYTNLKYNNADVVKTKATSVRFKEFYFSRKYPTANIGNMAYVGTEDPYEICLYTKESWCDTGKTNLLSSVDLGQYYVKKETDEIEQTPVKHVAVNAELASESASTAKENADDPAKQASAVATSALYAVSMAEQAVEIVNEATDASIGNGFGYNVTIHEMKGKVHTQASAIKDVLAKHRMIGQKVTFCTQNGDWVTYHNEPLSFENFTNTDDWVQAGGDSSVAGDINISYYPDYEDLTETEDGTIKFTNKEDNSESFMGIGRVYLRKNILDGTNALTQDMIDKPNTIYIIQNDYDLQGSEIIIPEGCMLDFQGGSFRNGIVEGNNTKLLNYPEYAIFNDCLVKGFRFQYIDIRWFGALEGKDCSDALQRAVNTYNKMILTPIRIVGEYKLEKTVKADNGIIINNNVTNSFVRDNRLYDGDTATPMGKITVENAITCIDVDRSNPPISTHLAQEALVSIIGLRVINEAKNATFMRYRCGGWPTGHHIIKYNRFEGFDRVLYFAGGEASANSQAFAMTIDHTDFVKGNYAIYAVPENPKVADSSFTNMVISNCRINTGSKLYIKGLYGSNTIKDTTVEGTSIEGTQVETPIIYLGLRTGNLTFENNYLEKIDGYIFIEGTNDTYRSFYSEVNLRGNYYMWDSYANPKLKYYFKNIRISSINYNLPNNNLFLENVSINANELENNAYNAFNLKSLNISNISNNSILLTGNSYRILGLNAYNNITDGGSNIISGVFSRPSDSVISYNNSILGYKFGAGALSKELSYNSIVGENVLEAGDYIFACYKGDGVLDISLYDGETLLMTNKSQFGHGNYLFKVTIVKPIINPIIKVVFIPKLVAFSYITPICVMPVYTKGIEPQYISNFNIVLGNNSKMGDIRYGSYSTMPKFNENVIAAQYYDTYHQRPAWFYDGKWRFADGLPVGIVHSGTFDEKPINPPRGFAYYCINRKTEEGVTNGIVIYHKGDNVWVDALGRVIE